MMTREIEEVSAEDTRIQWAASLYKEQNLEGWSAQAVHNL